MTKSSTQFRCVVSVPSHARSWNHHTSFVALGSCFADEIGRRLEQHLFATCRIPFGALFGPAVIGNLVSRALQRRHFEEAECFSHQELWRHFDIHSKFASQELTTFLKLNNKKLDTLSESLLSTNVLIISLGTAWAYRHLESDKWVGHNHRLPLDHFERRLFTVEEVVAHLSGPLEQLLLLNPDCQIIFTVSPVRYLRDGLHQNNLSKATLLLAMEKLEKAFDQAHSFPAYEIVMDELRDYRFFEEDMSHPNKQAIDYVWSRFNETYFDSPCRTRIQQIASLRSALRHRPQHPDTEASTNLHRELGIRIEQLAQLGLPVQSLLALHKREESA